MTDKIQQARRAAFEAAYLKQYFYPAERWSLVPEKYRTQHAEIAWWAFNAALDAVVIKLPPEFDDVHNYACYQGGWNDMRGEAVDAIESTSLGIKVK